MSRAAESLNVDQAPRLFREPVEPELAAVGKRLGFRRPFGNQLVFDIEDVNGARLTFDAETGRRLTAPGKS